MIARAIAYDSGMPPAPRNEWTLTFTAADATMSWRPRNDPATPLWTRTVPLTADARAALYRDLRDAGAFDTGDRGVAGIGGPTSRVTVTADGETYDTARLAAARQSLPRAAHDAALRLLPPEVWAEFEHRQKEFGG
ncbi:hypothetical protein [Actinokineospora xionganensis]|uniref:YbaB/EbfC DNA-binding family protein n=1 Tax=Actinokineospora xionganensis TaxID=2684470 RepID=A0ABR7LD94_9PSEU|nr:hypothetical protein [Actinokineospora xionganensis]MBC6450645.1 hypothetical protein [Actinokineospora xionganensis]